MNPTPAPSPLEALAARFIDHGCREMDPDIEDLAGLVEDTGGAGFCEDVSRAFCAWARAHDYPCRPVYVAPGQKAGGVSYPDGHWIATDGYHFVDFTARQFDEAAPFPHIWR